MTVSLQTWFYLLLFAVYSYIITRILLLFFCGYDPKQNVLFFCVLKEIFLDTFYQKKKVLVGHECLLHILKPVTFYKSLSTVPSATYFVISGPVSC